MVRTLALDEILNQYLESRCLEGGPLEGLEGTRNNPGVLYCAHIYISCDLHI